MSSDVLAFFRETAPEVRDLSDDDLTQFIGESFPEFKTEVPEFGKRYNLVSEKSAPKESPTRAAVKEAADYVVGGLRDAGAKTVRDVQSAIGTSLSERVGLPSGGKLMSKAGGLLAEDARKGLEMSGTDPSSLPGQIVTDAARLAPTIAVSGVAGGAGMSAPVAMGLPMAEQALSETDSLVAAAQAGLMGAVLPGVGKLGGDVGGNLAGRIAARMANQKAQTATVEAGRLIGSQALIDGLMTVDKSPELYELSKTNPGKARDELVKLVASNLVFEAPHLPAAARALLARDHVDAYIESPEYRSVIDGQAQDSVPGMREQGAPAPGRPGVPPAPPEPISKVPEPQPIQPAPEPVPVPKPIAEAAPEPAPQIPTENPIDTAPPVAQPELNEPRQPQPNPPGVDVREPAGVGPATEPVQEAGPVPQPDQPAGPSVGGPVEGEGAPGGSGVPSGDGKRPRAKRRTGDERKPAGTPPVEGAGSGLQSPGELLGNLKRKLAEQEATNQAVDDRLVQQISELERQGVTPELPEPKPQAAPERPAPENHVLPADEDWIPSGDKAKTRANLDAIRLLKQLETENRDATPEERAILAKYTGWGGLKEIFDEGKANYRKTPPWSEVQKKEAANWEKAWGKLYDETKGLLTPEEHAAAAKSILNAHYSARKVINAVWSAVQRLGFIGGKALEPAAGIGHFIGLTPEALRGTTKWSAVELDSISGRIAAKLYPNARIHLMGFQDARIAPNSHDLVISNVPFAKDGPIDKRYPAMSLHNYFFARSLDLVKPGGIVAAITSDSTMDGGRSEAARKWMAERADLVGAIRLPNNAFAENAGTEVTTDILFFRKKDGTQFAGEPFVRTEATKTAKGEPIQINEYFVRHPEMMLGRMSLEGTMYRGGQQALVPTPGAVLSEQLAKAIQALPENVFGEAKVTAPDAPEAAVNAKLGQLVFKDGVPHVVEAGGGLEKPDWADDPKKRKQAVEYVGIRDGTRKLIATMLDENATEAAIASEREKLKAAYDKYVSKYGPINERKSSFLDDDVDFPLALALEDGETKSIDIGGGRTKRVTEWKPAKILSERTLFPRTAPNRVDTVPDALQVAQNFRGRVDPDYIAELTGRSRDSVVEELEGTGIAFENPETGKWENRATFLSGFVRKKLKAAEAAAQADPRFERHVAELKAVQPAPLSIQQIGFKLGSVFIPERVIEGFLRDRLEVEAVVSFTPQTGTWTIRPGAGWSNARNTTTYGLHDAKGNQVVKGHELIQDSLNLKATIITKPEERTGEDGKTKEVQVKDPVKSLEAQQKQSEIQDEFKAYLKSHPEFASEVEAIYNDRYNGTVAPRFEAPTWTHYPGAASNITLREHQKAVVTRMLQNSTLLAHAVGTGKTYAIVTAAMEMRRLGLAKKPAIVVQNATLEQFARDFKKLYPTARILAPNARQRDAKNRNRTMSRIATGDWDAVIIPQSFVNMMPDDPGRERRYIQDEIRELVSAKLQAASSEGKNSPKASDLQKAIDRLEERLKDLADRAKDDVLTFEQTGIDGLFVDEAHAYKKLQFATQMDNIKGLDKGASKRGWSMSMKTRWVQEKNQGKNVIFATGTPVSNTVAEAWTMMRYVRPDVLKEYGIEKFDDFASTFGDSLTQLEMTPTGDWKPVTRFARFQNGPELIAAWRTVADVVTPEEVNLPGIPSLKGGKPTPVNVPQTEAIAKYVAYLKSELERFAAMSGKEKRENSHIPIVVMTLARKAMPDIRMINPDAPDEPGSKLNHLARNVIEIYHESSPVKGTQMVFQDLYQDNPDEPRFNLYEELKRKLIEGGIPENEILIVDETIKDAKRDAVFQKLKAGEIRVAIGGTEKMGVGVNAQDHLIALHHMSPPLRPMDIEQRNGRILRQGNQNPEVQIFNYGVEKSLDSALYQLLATKQKFINQIIRGDISGRNFEDAANEQSLSFEDAMAAFSGDPRAMKKVTLENQIRQLEALRSGHYEAERKARESLANLESRVIPAAEKAAVDTKRRAEEMAKAFPKDGPLTAEIDGKTVSGKKDISAALDTVFSAGKALTVQHGQEQNKFGEFSIPLGEFTLNGQGIELTGYGRPNAKGVIDPEQTAVGWRFKDGGAGGRSTTGQGFFTSLTATLERIAQEPAQAAARVSSEHRNLREIRSLIGKPFDREADLNNARQELAQLKGELEAEGKAGGSAEEQAKMQGGTALVGEAASMAGGDQSGNPAEGRIEAYGASVPAAKSKPVVPPAVAKVPKAPVGPVRAWFQQHAANFKAVFAPHTIDSSGEQVALIMRSLLGKQANQLARAADQMDAIRAEFDRTPVPADWKWEAGKPLPYNYEIIDALERRRGDLPERYRELADTFDAEFRWRIEEIQRYAPHALRQLIDNYFPHIWEDPQRASGVMSQQSTRLFAGSKEFLKKRSIPIFAEGLSRGLKPISDNPVDLLLAKMHSMDRFLTALRAQDQFKRSGHMKFKYVFEPVPEGHRIIDDPAFVVQAPPVVTVREAYDRYQWTTTMELLKRLGVPHSRVASLGGARRWGAAWERPEQIKTRFAGPLSIVWHELGHVLDFRYKLQSQFIGKGDPFDAQLKALAAARGEGKQVGKKTQKYFQNSAEKMAVMAEAYVHAPVRFERLAPDVYAQFSKFIADHPELHALTELRDNRGSLSMDTREQEIRLGGPIQLGHWVMPDGAAQVIHNYLSPGFGGSSVFRSLRSASNLLNAAQLGISGFHVGFTSLDATVSAVEVGMWQSAHGKLGKGLGTMSKGLVAPVLNYYEGKRVQSAMIRPDASHVDVLGIGRIPVTTTDRMIANLAVNAGLRGTTDPQWQTHFTRSLIRTWHQGGLGMATIGFKLPAALVEQSMRPIAEFLVPRQKLGVFALMAKAELDRLGNADTATVRAAMARAADATEDRMGQMTYDNLFYNRAAKDLALIAFRAYGWQLGKYRHLAGAVADTGAAVKAMAAGKAPEITHRMAYMVALPVVVGAIGGVMHRLFTGSAPQTVQDYLHPATGTDDPQGRPVRLSLPSYLKDLEMDAIGLSRGWSHGGPLGAARGLWEGVYHRANPWLAAAVEMLENKDFYGTKIFEETDPMMQKVSDQALHVLNQFEPFSVSGLRKMRENEAPTSEWLLPFIGVVPANRLITSTPAEARAAELLGEMRSEGGRSRNPADEVKKDVLRELRKDPVRGTEALQVALTNGRITADEARALSARSRLTPLQYQVTKLPIEKALAVWDLANPAERDSLRVNMYQKLQSAIQRGAVKEEEASRILKVITSPAQSN